MAGLVPAILFPAAKKDRRVKPGGDVNRASMAMMLIHHPIVTPSCR